MEDGRCYYPAINPDQLLPRNLWGLLRSDSLGVLQAEQNGCNFRRYMIWDQRAYRPRGGLESKFEFPSSFMEFDPTHIQPCRPIAFLRLSAAEQILFIDMIDVNADMRGRGVGSAIVQHLAKIAQQFKFRYMSGYHTGPEATMFFLKNDFYLWDELREGVKPELEPVTQAPLFDGGMYCTVRPLEQSRIHRVVMREARYLPITDRLRRHLTHYGHLHIYRD